MGGGQIFYLLERKEIKAKVLQVIQDLRKYKKIIVFFQTNQKLSKIPQKSEALSLEDPRMSASPNPHETRVSNQFNFYL